MRGLIGGAHHRIDMESYELDGVVTEQFAALLIRKRAEGGHRQVASRRVVKEPRVGNLYSAESAVTTLSKWRRAAASAASGSPATTATTMAR